ncbi:MAG: hypothetical protein COV74_08740 [Candidatus Omnitrophica bacterium CG11_big_fil_rev_8_21_14_0_20_45_26]|uniref:Beta-glucosidase n=1 Tax=Candidatus Abzuiibacterium crystallinum TaxID=1974748 RepID=A0A2H0LMK6_9BACT|nr:MAG: hypothetical protein COV74_08740 [Candidatus Omnitrophica bacterium CG11_big_fil_rev_8_21_14_0_20_45_26]PIW63747.1 MAG: hypothetical protein COW12_09625 [Candidatus Omnitrophica bacterium CG12_big_fil_rev_8_21_14_0_65_45_16]
MNSMKFPSDFLWGAATSAHQVEGNNQLNDWWQWEQAGKTKNVSGAACDHYVRFQEDFDIAKVLNHKAHRFSIEWSRIEPEEGKFNQEAIQHYQEVVRALQARNLEPVITLHHFTNPIWFSSKGGWKQKQAVYFFNRFVTEVVTALAPLGVRYWITINEPMVYLYQGFVIGVWPPGEKSIVSAFRAFRSLLRAHVEAYKTIHQIYQPLNKHPLVGLAKHMLIFSPCRPQSWQDRFVTWMRNFLFNHSLSDAFLIGRMIPFPWVFSKRYLDFWGLNYYTRDFIHFKPSFSRELFGEVCTQTHHRETGERNMMGWEIYPAGLYDCLMALSKFKLPILITENGICTDDDHQRERFIQTHLFMVARAVMEGASVIGYLHWSLLDNFEWHWGFGPRFGLVAVDYQTQKRRIKLSGQMLSRICETGQIEN